MLALAFNACRVRLMVRAFFATLLLCISSPVQLHWIALVNFIRSDYNYNIHLYSAALQCCPGTLTDSKTYKHNRKKQYCSDDETVKQLGIRECSFNQDGLKCFFKFTNVSNIV